MAAYVILLLVVLAAGVLFVLYRRGVLPEIGASKEPTGRLHRRAEEGERSEQRPRGDQFVDSQAAVWDSGGREDVEPPPLFVDDVLDEEPAYEEPEYEAAEAEPEYEEPEYVEPEYVEPEYEEPEYEEPEYEVAEHDGGVELDEEPVVDRFAARAAPPARPTAEPEPEPEVLVTSDGSSTLAKRTPKSESDSKRQPARLAQTQQRPSGVARRSPDQVRSMLTSYRGGLKKARDDDERPE